MIQSFKKIMIRYLIREELNLLDFSIVKEKSKKIEHKLLSVKEIRKSETVFVYISMKDEVQTFDIIDHLLEKGKKVVVPKVKGDKMEIVRFKENCKLVHGKYGILEPKGKDKYKGKIDVAIVPGLVFSMSGKRVGKGGGYYDKFLSENNDIYKIGVCFGFQIFDEDIVPVEKHDIKMDKVIYD
ncbi:5-formyltetrahydrofolate cyclo-ligase [Candidatus Gracilibacteria bacterium]|nr:5-formyltetrahydrofolate cyclo-ligase [Candidatus Gracilibacteria bacterium]